MKRHLNTLYVSTDGAYLSKEGRAVRVTVAKQVRLRVPLLHLDGIVCFGRVSCSPQLLGCCAEGGIRVSWLTPTGRLLACSVGFSPGNVLLRRAQYRASDSPEASASIARNVVSAKIANCRTVLLRGARDASNAADADALRATAGALGNSLESVRRATDLDALRGHEGEAAANYFGVFNHLLGNADDAFRISGRSRRPPLDPTNALLSFLYGLLCHDARSACESVGLDAAVGFLHRDRPGRPGLALDLMEEFRPFLADRLALSLANRRQLSKSDFQRTESGAVLLSESGRKTVLAAYQKRKQEELTHWFIEEKATVGLFLHLQARLLARRLRGDLDDYPSFLWK